jgi:hypothetical protein
MNILEYQICVNECNMAMTKKDKQFFFEGKKFNIEFRYVLATMAESQGYKATFEDKILIIKPQ